MCQHHAAAHTKRPIATGAKSAGPLKALRFQRPIDCYGISKLDKEPLLVVSTYPWWWII
jgi:hypothetical protein